MDIREPVLAIVVGGSVAPGLNGVISAVTLEALSNKLTVIGVYDGFSAMKHGSSNVMNLTVDKVSHIQDEGGCILGSSMEVPETDQEVDNVLRVLAYRRVQYLVTVGGVNTALCATRVAAAAASQQLGISIVHVPKTIYNTLPLPFNTTTFGYSTARQEGTLMVSTFHQDARTMKRFWLVTIGGSSAGHLALGIGKSMGATLVVIPEEFKDTQGGKAFSLEDVVDRVESTVFKRLAANKNYGTIVLAGGLVKLFKADELKETFGCTTYEQAEELLGARLAEKLSANVANYKYDGSVSFRTRLLDSELRAARPNAQDVELTRDLGFGAVRYMLDGGDGDMICRREGEIVRVKLSDCVDFDTRKTKIRYVNTNSLQYKVACRYQIRLTTSDLQSKQKIKKMASIADIESEEFVARFDATSHSSIAQPRYKAYKAPTFVISEAPKMTYKERMQSVDGDGYQNLLDRSDIEKEQLLLRI
jgi:6-phosphofructokinase